MIMRCISPLLRCQNNKCGRRNSSSVAIIGAGTCGLTALKELQNDGIYKLKLFDNSNDIGGQWNVENKNSNTYSKMMTNTALDNWFYSDFPYIQDPNQSHFNTLFEQQNQMKKYAKYFDLYENIQFNSNVTSIISADENNPETEGWSITYNYNNEERTEEFDKVIICTGSHNIPKHPENVSSVLNNGKYQGNIYNSQQIDEIEFKNKRVLIIGGSVSGLDYSEHAINEGAEHVYLNYRSKFVQIPSYIQQQDGKIINYTDVLCNRGYPQQDILQLFNNPHLDEYGFHAPDDINFEEGIPRWSPCKNAIHYMKTGQLRGIYGNMINVELETKNIQFQSLNDNNDIIKLNDIDIIVYATGFDLGPPSCPLQESIFNKIYNLKYPKKRLLYLSTFIPGYKQNNLAFNGMNVSFAGATYELQSRLISNVWTNRTSLPNEKEQNKWIKEFFDNDAVKWYPAIAPQPLTDDIAEMIGVLPKEEDYPNKELYDKVQHDRLFATQFRIKGYGKNPLAIPTLIYQLNSNPEDNKQMREEITGVDGDSPDIILSLTDNQKKEKVIE